MKKRLKEMCEQPEVKVVLEVQEMNDSVGKLSRACRVACPAKTMCQCQCQCRDTPQDAVSDPGQSTADWPTALQVGNYWPSRYAREGRYQLALLQNNDSTVQSVDCGVNGSA